MDRLSVQDYLRVPVQQVNNFQFILPVRSMILPAVGDIVDDDLCILRFIMLFSADPVHFLPPACILHLYSGQTLDMSIMP